MASTHSVSFNVGTQCWTDGGSGLAQPVGWVLSFAQIAWTHSRLLYMQAGGAVIQTVAFVGQEWSKEVQRPQNAVANSVSSLTPDAFLIANSENMCW